MAATRSEIHLETVRAFIRANWPALDTRDMARALKVHESVVANELARIRAEQRARA